MTFRDAKSMKTENYPSPRSPLNGLAPQNSNPGFGQMPAQLLDQKLWPALDTAGLAAWAWDMQSGESVWTEEYYRALGYQVGDVQPSCQSLLDRVHPDDLNAIRAMLRNGIERDCACRAQFRVLLPDGSVRWMETRGGFERSPLGRPLRFYAILTDITALKDAEAVAERRREQLERLTSELVNAEQRERRRLAAVLHDTLQQTLAAAKFSISLLEEGPDLRKAIAETVAIIDEAIQTTRSLACDLTPLTNQGLIASLEWLARWMFDKHGLTVRLSARNSVGVLPKELVIVLFQSTRELLFNVVKHARVDQANLEVALSEGCIHVFVADQGVGFDPDLLRSESGSGRGFGLHSIQERLEYIGGRMEISSSPGQGSRFELISPGHAFAEEISSVSQDAAGITAEFITREARAPRTMKKKGKVAFLAPHPIRTQARMAVAERRAAR